ncbi:hypothetical protein FQN53_007390 [Emmonsiellopsis sp. PD_33]|nr:hypothetical protein FQN53_007390 [Emmonsiellopsis sp. PD_33]
MIPKTPLPLSAEWADTDAYVESLLSFATTSSLFRNLCGGMHILDFLTRVPDLYTTVLPEEWRVFFAHHEIGPTLDLFMREDIHVLQGMVEKQRNGTEIGWRDGPAPPASLVEYIHQIRRHCLQREFTPQSQSEQQNGRESIPSHIAVGMKPKKSHEVANFSRYVDSLAGHVGQERGEEVSHVVDFGSGQNYLGRTLASPLYNRRIIAIERRHHNISGAMGKDVHAKLKKKLVVLGGKKGKGNGEETNGVAPDAGVAAKVVVELDPDSAVSTPNNEEVQDAKALAKQENLTAVVHVSGDKELNPTGCVDCSNGHTEEEEEFQGSMDYIEHDIQDGYLEPIIKHVVEPTPASNNQDQNHSKGTLPKNSPPPRVMVISLHSCGNLVHHGIRSLILNPSVVAIAMIGCCYNLMTERLGPVTYKLPILRSLHPRLESTSKAYDPHGFPMSKRLETYSHEGGTSIKLNITARMMAVQAPYNWGPTDSEAFFTRHYFRALLQRILVDYGVVPVPGSSSAIGGVSMEEEIEVSGTPLIVGSLRKAAFTSFTAYVRAAIAKLSRDPHYGAAILEKVAGLSDETLTRYEADYAPTKKNLSVVWSLMAFSASVVESIIVTDRWLFLKEQEGVKEAWVETVFDYGLSPRNLVVVGVKE